MATVTRIIDDETPTPPADVSVLDRVARVGWKVIAANNDTYTVRTGTGEEYKITIKEGKTRNAGGDFRKELQQAEANQRRTAHQRELRANAARVLAKASGPYQIPEEVELDWYAQKHPSPWMRWVIMTPEIAKWLLDNRNTDNRPIVATTHEHYQLIILSGQWRLTHQGAAMDTRGVLQDGQHRLKAIVDSGIAAPMPFYVGMDPENFKHIDEGRLRTAAQLFARDGEAYGPLKQTLIRLVTAYGEPHARRTFRNKIPTAVTYDYLQREPEALHIAARFGSSNYKKIGSVSGATAAAYYLIRKRNGATNPFVAAFFEGLATGRKAGTRIVLDDDDPRQVLREYFASLRTKRRQIPGIDHVALFVHAWNNLVNDVRLRMFRFDGDIPIRPILLCTPDESSAPPLLHGEIPTYNEDDDSEGE